ncbi:MAG: segregation/condensation protein A [Actinomycetota bacterium]|nr:segregation/condensation protein A [Actinomycetota bacterium]
MPSDMLRNLELDLDVFSGPFDLLLSLILREELDLLEVQLAEIVIAYLDHLERRERLNLEAATEFLVLIAALLELKSRLMLPGEEVEELDELEPAQAAEELLDRMLRYARYQNAGQWLIERQEAGQQFLLRESGPPAELSKTAEKPRATHDPQLLARAVGGLLKMPPAPDLRHLRNPRVSVADRLTILRDLLRRGRFDFERAVAGQDRMTVAVTLYALLELYKRGEADWEQEVPFAPITVAVGGNPAAPAVAS